MTVFIPSVLKISAVTLAEELSFASAAQRLRISPAVLRAQMSELAMLLEYTLFREDGDHVELREDGQVLIAAFRSALSKNTEGGPESS